MDKFIAIIGAGFSGLGIAIKLKQLGIEDFTIFERAGAIGGTWRDNTYPGCACDVESYLYSFSFAPNPHWTRTYSNQAEIWKYLQDCVDRFSIRSRIQFNQEVKEAKWDVSNQVWRIVTQQGSYTARILISAPGALSEPRTPKLPGLATFQGKVMHSAQWDHEYNLSNKRVAVIGTGASAIQFVPKIQPKVSSLLLFQRNAPWVVPSVDRPISSWERKLVRLFPSLQDFKRRKIFLSREALGFAFRQPKLMKILEKAAQLHMKRAVKDPVLRQKLTPNYTMGCKRILISNDYYPSLIQKNVEVITDGIREFRPASVITETGTELPIDTVILGTGFQVTDAPYAQIIFGKRGMALADEWQGSPRAHLGTTVSGFPNLFLLLGPNTGLGHTSVLLMIESQMEHILRAIQYMKDNGVAALEPKTEAERQFNSEIEAKMKPTVWVTGGCMSWYLDKTGRNSTLWPSSISAFRKRVEPFKINDYSINNFV